MTTDEGTVRAILHDIRTGNARPQAEHATHFLVIPPGLDPAPAPPSPSVFMPTIRERRLVPLRAASDATASSLGIASEHGDESMPSDDLSVPPPVVEPAERPMWRFPMPQWRNTTMSDSSGSTSTSMPGSGGAFASRSRSRTPTPSSEPATIESESPIRRPPGSNRVQIQCTSLPSSWKAA